MSDNDAFATAAHLHVVLRRKTGRVTDTEWMASNAEYALAIVKFARDKAGSEGLVELLPLADRLEALAHRFHQPVRKSLLQIGAEHLQHARRSADSRASAGDDADASEPDARYVGRLR